MSTTNTGMSSSRPIVRAFGSSASGAGTAVVAIPAKSTGRRPEYPLAMVDNLRVQGFVNAHSHAFQRALRGRTEGEDFWAWRETMLDLAKGQTPDGVRSEYAAVYAEMLDAGYTAVGEFHYLGLAEAHAAAEAAAEAGIELVLLYVAYGRGGIDRFRQDSVAEYLRGLEELREAGVRGRRRPHSVRACTRDWLEELGRYAAEHGLPLHVHADEQPREIEECLAEHGSARSSCSPPAVASGRRRRSCMRRTRTAASSTSSARQARDLRVPHDGGEPRGRLPPGRAGSPPVASACASAPIRTSASTRSRSCASSTASRAARPGGATSSAWTTSWRSAHAEGAAALGIEQWPAIEIDAAHPQLRAWTSRSTRSFTAARRTSSCALVDLGQLDRERHLVLRERSRVAAVELDQAPEVAVERQRQHQQRANP